MNNSKPVSTPLLDHLKLSTKQLSTSEKEKEGMQNILYSSTIGSLTYAMDCTRLKIAHIVGVVSCSLSNPRKEH